MSKKTKYSREWKESYPWLAPVEGDIYSAKCTLCKGKSFSIKNRGVSQVQQHAQTSGHVKLAKQMETQSTLQSKDGIATPAKGQIYLTQKEKVAKAEVIQALYLVEKNQSFSSANGDGRRFRVMFPDSDIAKNYSQEETKIKYIVQFGIAPFVNEKISKDFCEKPFTFKFDESTTEQVKKQYDGYITYFSSTRKRVVTSYCGSLFVGHCTADDLVSHFFEFMEKLKLNLNLLLALGMDGPSVNKSFERKLRLELEKRGSTRFLDLGTCTLHSVNNAFSEGLSELKDVINLDQFAIDIHFFFKYSAARREDYKEMESITEITTQFVLKHCQTRWLSLDKVLVRIIEQFENLKAYFLEKLLTLSGFKGKNGVQQTERYQRIKANLTDPVLLPYMLFIVHVAQDYKELILPLQAEEPKIHVLHSKCTKLLKDLLSKFIAPGNYLKEGSVRLLPKERLVAIIKDEEKHKVDPDFGNRIKSLLSKLDGIKKKKFMQTAVKVLSSSTQYLVNRLPIDNQIIRDAKYLQPFVQKHSFGPNAVSRLAYSVANVLGQKEMRKMFSLTESATEYDLSDVIKKEFTEYQTESIQESFYIKEASETNTRQQTSYWRYAYGVAGVDLVDKRPEGNYKRIDDYWLQVSKIRDGEGKAKYQNLWILVRCVLSLPHGNADPERGFSINKRLLQIHGTSLKEETVEALRLVKDYIITENGVENIAITKDLLTSCAIANSRYKAHLEEKKRQEELMKEKQKELEQNKQLSEKMEQVERDIHVLKKGIEIAERCIEEGNEQLGEIVKSKTLNRDKLLSCQSKISMGVKRKSELSAELKDLEKKLEKKKKKL